MPVSEPEVKNREKARSKISLYLSLGMAPCNGVMSDSVGDPMRKNRSTGSLLGKIKLLRAKEFKKLVQLPFVCMKY